MKQVKPTKYNDKQSLNENNYINEYINDVYKLYLGDIKSKCLSKKEEQALAVAIKNGDLAARNMLIESNLYLVISIAKKYQGNGLDILDLIQEGNIGLMMAVDKFDYTLGNCFSTYATIWIKKNILRTIENSSNIIRKPSYIYENKSLYQKAIASLRFELKREPTTLEIANKLEISIAAVNEIMVNLVDVLSINAVLGEESDDELADILPSNEQDIEDKIIEKIKIEEIRKALESCQLKDKYFEILKLYFGLYDEEAMTFEEIGKLYNSSRSNINGLEKKALQKIRDSKAFIN